MTGSPRIPTDGAPPEMLGGYRLVELLGRGGMGEVFRAEREGPGGYKRRAAIKRILPRYQNDPTLRARFLAEARINARLEHPNIVQVLDFGDQPEPYLALEFVEGTTVARVLKVCADTGQRVPAAAAAFMVAEAATGLDYAHRRKNENDEALHIVHRDVSPQNVLISIDGMVKVSDFGIARAADNQLRTAAGISVGKMAYMAPEQATGAPVDRRSDVFALGVVFWELLMVRPLIPRNDSAAAIRMLMSGGFDPPSRLDPKLPPRLDEIALAALAVEPDKRTPTAAQLAQQLRGFLHSVAPGFDGGELVRILCRLVPEVRWQSSTSGQQPAYVPLATPMNPMPAIAPPRAPMQAGPPPQSGPPSLAGPPPQNLGPPQGPSSQVARTRESPSLPTPFLPPRAPAPVGMPGMPGMPSGAGPSEVYRAPYPPVPPRAPRRSSRWLLIAVIGVGLLVAAAASTAGIWYLRHSSDDEPRASPASQSSLPTPAPPGTNVPAPRPPLQVPGVPPPIPMPPLNTPSAVPPLQPMQPVAPPGVAPGPSEASGHSDDLARRAMLGVAGAVHACMRNNADGTRTADVDATFDNTTGRLTGARVSRLEPEGVRAGEIRNCIDRAVQGAHFTPEPGAQGITSRRQRYVISQQGEPSPLGGGITPMGPVGPRF
ncbi:MAG: protein kinase [Deltaproteobacteria bacterium]|nr:protein kinase [Deltaproteobacteria bacterium]